MSEIIVFTNDYNGDTVNYNIIDYTFKSDYALFIYTGNVNSNDNAKYIADSFGATQRIFGKDEDIKKIEHIVLAFDRKWIYSAPVEMHELLKKVVNYYADRGFQIVGVYHFRSDKNKSNEHIHLVINRISINNKVLYEDNTEYYRLVSFLTGITHTSWKLVFKDSYDYFTDI